MIAGFHQFAPERAHPDRNADHIERALRASHLDLLVAPELALTGYLFRDRDALLALAETIPDGPRVRRLAAVVRETGRALVLGLAERDGERVYNAATLLTPDGRAITYRKAHLFDTECALFDRADSVPPVVELGGARIGLMICFDWRFPETARRLALDGADVIAHPSNLVHPFCQDAMITRALENRVYAVTANRTGTETVGPTTVAFSGRSQIVSPDGERLTVSDARETCVRTAPIDVERARDKRVTARNDLVRDRREDLYGDRLAPRAGAAR